MHGITAVRTWPLDPARTGFIALAVALIVAAAPVPAATTPPAPSGETKITVTPFPPSVQVDTGSADDSDADRGSKRSRRHRADIRIDTDRDFESFKDAMETAPWIVGAVFLVAGSIFLTPIVLLIGIIWYKLRKTRMQNEALLKLAEKGVMPPAQAADAVASGVMPASIAAGAAGNSTGSTVYQAAVATQRRVVWSDLRKGVLLSAIGLSLAMYSIIRSSSANWLGLMLLFVGIGYIVLWWLEDRHIAQRNSSGGSG
jgi:hypothetical protein